MQEGVTKPPVGDCDACLPGSGKTMFANQMVDAAKMKRGFAQSSVVQIGSLLAPMECIGTDVMSLLVLTNLS